jgi:hypothetical protein
MFSINYTTLLKLVDNQSIASLVNMTEGTEMTEFWLQDRHLLKFVSSHGRLQFFLRSNVESASTSVSEPKCKIPHSLYIGVDVSGSEHDEKVSI